MKTRFAPSPTGPLHLGHAYAALTAFNLAQHHGGEMLLRIEDTDRARCRPEWETQIHDDLGWLGLSWPSPVARQSDHLSRYQTALDQLTSRGLLYPCSCNRADIRNALSAPQEGAPHGPDGLVYPGTCRARPMASRQPGDALRLNMARALQTLSTCPEWEELGPIHPGLFKLDPHSLLTHVGDVVLARRQSGDIAYHLAVTLDDAAQGITHVTRGADLFDATQIHVLLQALLGLPTPHYLHHDLVRDASGKRLAKRDDARALRTYRQQGLSPTDLRALLPALPDL